LNADLRNPLSRGPKTCHNLKIMRFHASCAARPGEGGFDAVLLLGASGSGKSDLLLRLLDRGWGFVADDQVIVEAGMARSVPALRGILEIRGLGLFHVPCIDLAPVRLVVQLAREPARLPEPARHAGLGVPEVSLDPFTASAPVRVEFALDAALGRTVNLTGAFAA
jgi:HPr kinase/phosphorylase